MNFTADWIGVYEKSYRNRCVALGEKTGLYKGEMVSKGCTPDYLPELIKIRATKEIYNEYKLRCKTGVNLCQIKSLLLHIVLANWRSIIR